MQHMLFSLLYMLKMLKTPDLIDNISYACEAGNNWNCYQTKKYIFDKKDYISSNLLYNSH